MEPRGSIATPTNVLQAAFFVLPSSLQLLLVAALFLAIAIAGTKVLYELGRWLSD